MKRLIPDGGASPRVAAVVILGIAMWLLLPAQPAAAKSFSLPSARFVADVSRSGAVHVTEKITFDFDGSFSGAFREINLRDGEAVTDISVRENDRPYVPGASAELGSSGAPDTFGDIPTPEGHRIVWHFNAFNETRTFTVRYTVTGLAVAHDDVTDLNIQVWGDEWDVGLGRLEAVIRLPRPASGDLRVFGHPATVDGFTELRADGSGSSLVASNIDPHEFAEMRLVFPTDVLANTNDAKVESGDALDDILAEEQAFAANVQDQRDQQRWLTSNAWWLLLLGLLLAFVPAAGIAYAVYRDYGKEPEVPPGPEYVFEPPAADPPALIAGLLEPSGARATGNAFTATLFDLVRRGYIEAIPVNTIRKTWGGLKQEDVTDLAVRVVDKPQGDLPEFERVVLRCVGHAETQERDAHGDDRPGEAGVIDLEGRLLLSELRGNIADEPAFYAGEFTAFKSDVLAQVKARGWWVAGGLKWLVVGLLAFLLCAGLFFFLAIATYDPVAVFNLRTIVFAALTLIAGCNAVVLLVFAFFRRAWEKRSDAAANVAVGWTAFRRFLNDFAGMREAVPGSIAIWEQYLCYGIAFGVADRVLAAAQLHAPPELNQTSSVYWVGGYGQPGAGLSSFAIADISHAISTARPPSSSGSSGGFGGGFSGGGGGGGVGGGGGAW